MYAIVDIETTGGRQIDRITEIAVYVHDGTKIVDEYTTLVNPELSIPYFVQRLTGITNEMVTSAPKFYEVARRIVEITNNCMFVAHNASFDYNFLKGEFKRLGYHYKRKMLCTVKLSRRLLPGMPSYSLGKLCNELGIEVVGRHRAAGDALATVKLFEKLLSVGVDSKDIFSSSRLSAISRHHPLLDPLKIEGLPEEPGVYHFHDDKNNLIYIGKSRNIYSRVMAHFGNNTTRAMNMCERIADIQYELTGSELIALLIESAEIKKNKPVFNRAQRRTGYTYGIFESTDANGYRVLKLDKNNCSELPLMTFTSKFEGQRWLEKTVEKNRLCQKLTGLYKTDGACFHHAVQQCDGACIGQEPPDEYNLRVEKALSAFRFDNQNFFIIDKGRNKDEKAVIKIEKGRYIGWGYADTMEAVSDIESLNNYITPADDNRDVQQIIRSYLRHHKVEKMIIY
ncbi:MAG: exonuclease domain-containing protein [Bacteroidota bacterium]